jgi:hypothetical protein
MVSRLAAQYLHGAPAAHGCCTGTRPVPPCSNGGFCYTLQPLLHAAGARCSEGNIRICGAA